MHLFKDQIFVPAYASVSNIRIENTTTCQEAISILLDKYYVIMIIRQCL